MLPYHVIMLLLGAKQRFNKERFQLLGNLRSARCSSFIIFKVLAARMTKLITTHARTLANVRKDHSIPLIDQNRKPQMKSL